MASSSLSIRAPQPQPVAKNKPTPADANPEPPATTSGNKSSASSLPIPAPTAATPATTPTATSTGTATSSRKGLAKTSLKESTPTIASKGNSEHGSAKGLGLNTAQPTAATAALSPSTTSPINPGVDPLSQHIFARTNTDPYSIKQARLRNTTVAIPESPGPGLDLPLQSPDLTSRQPANFVDAARDKKKGGSFFSRLGIRKSKADIDSVPDSDSELGSERRMNGADAGVFSNNVDARGFVPVHKEPPRYIRVKAQNAKSQERQFNRMFLAQELIGTQPKLTESGEPVDAKVPIVTVSVAGAGGRRREKTGGAIWATEFSKDGKYLAAAGKDGVVRVWAVISTPEERRAQEEEEAAVAPVGERLSAPVFLERPIRQFSGHTNEVVDLSWSKNNFLLSTSMDKTVRLWHTTRDECLCQFKHKDVVTKIAFHPTDDRFFLAGSLDMTLRLWSIPDKQVAWSVHLPDLITAVAFTPDGKIAIAGLLNGLCMLYETEGLKFHSQIHARSSRGRNSKGSKITGISVMAMPVNSGGKGTEPGEVKVLVSTNDSRIRVYNLKDGSLDTKFKGHENTCTQISASFSDDAQYVISGSENRKAFIWKTGPTSISDAGKDKHPCETFDAHSDIVTTALFAPKKTRQLLSASGDPIYDLCNPPPVVLMSADEVAASAPQAATSESGSQEQLPSTPGLSRKKVEPSPAYISRTAHPGGNIIVTTDDQGILKIFRQDCAHKRRHESWETGSNLSRKPGGIIGIGRTSSIGSTAHSRRGSFNTGPPGKLSSDMIISWRQNVEGGRPKSIAGSMATLARSERSMSPAKNVRGSSANIAADARKLPYSLASPRHIPVRATASDVPDSPTSSVASRRRPLSAADVKKLPLAPAPRSKELDEEKRPTTPTKKDKDNKATESIPMSPPVPSFSFKPAQDGADDGLMKLDVAGASYAFWNLNRWKGLAGIKGSDAKSDGLKKHQRTSSDAVSSGIREEFEGTPRKSLGSLAISGQTTSPPISEPVDVETNSAKRPSHLRGRSHLSTVTTEDDDGYLRANSMVSKLSSELTSDSGIGAGTDKSTLTCRKCHAQKPKMKKVQGQEKMVCGRCGNIYTDGSD